MARNSKPTLTRVFCQHCGSYYYVEHGTHDCFKVCKSCDHLRHEHLPTMDSEDGDTIYICPTGVFNG